MKYRYDATKSFASRLLANERHSLPSADRTDAKRAGKRGARIRNRSVADSTGRADCGCAMNTTTKQKQIFSFNGPTAQSVLLAGDFTRWLKHPIPLRKQPDGVWRATASLTPGTYHYRFVVDGEWHDDPECKVRVQNPFGTQNDVIQIGQTTGNGQPGAACLADSKS